MVMVILISSSLVHQQQVPLVQPQPHLQLSQLLHLMAARKRLMVVIMRRRKRKMVAVKIMMMKMLKNMKMIWPIGPLDRRKHLLHYY
jgi:hypothetical protein